jgi:hypothetical protein
VLLACGEVYADSAYANKKNDEKLGKQNNKVLHRAYRNTPLTDRQKQENKQRSSIRYIVERTFGSHSRAIIHRAKTSNIALAQRFSVSTKTIAKWRNRDFVKDKTSRPKTIHYALNET